MLYVLVGIFSGALGGMGIGGGAVLVPVVTFFSQLGQHTVQGLNLISFIPSSASATFVYLKEKRLKGKIILAVSAAATAGALLGAWGVTLLDAGLLKKLFGGFLLALGVLQLIGARPRRRG